jgi:hypothetical protein
MGEEMWERVEKGENNVQFCTRGWREFYRLQDVRPSVSFPSCGHAALDTTNGVAQSVP